MVVMCLVVCIVPVMCRGQLVVYPSLACDVIFNIKSLCVITDWLEFWKIVNGELKYS